MNCFKFRLGQSVTDGDGIGVIMAMQTGLKDNKIGVVWPGQKKIIWKNESVLRLV